MNNHFITKKENRIKDKLSWRIASVVATVIFSIYSLFFLYIFFWLIMSCFKEHREITLKPFALPTVWHFEHFREMFEVFNYNDTKFLGMVWNSVWHSFGCTLIFLWVNASSAYITTKYKFPGVKLFAPVLMFGLIFPIYGSGSAGYRMIYGLGLANSWRIILTAGCFAGWNFFYFQSFFANLSWSYAEAAFMDGANDWQVYYKVMLPQSIGIIGALGIMFWTTAWTDYSSQILYMDKLPTLSVGIYYFQNEMTYRARMDILFCACLISFIPTFVLYACFNNVLFKNISLGGIKM